MIWDEKSACVCLINETECLGAITDYKNIIPHEDM